MSNRLVRILLSGAIISFYFQGSKRASFSNLAVNVVEEADSKYNIIH